MTADDNNLEASPRIMRELPAVIQETPLVKAETPATGDGVQGNEFAVPQRKRRRWPIVIGIIIVLIIAAGGVTYYVIHQQAAQQDSQRRDAYKTLNQAIALITESDAVVVRLDDAINKQVTIDDVPQLQALLDQIPTARSSLDTAVETATDAKNHFKDQDGLDLAQHVLNAASSRQVLLENGSGLIEKDIAATTSLSLLNEALDFLFDADSAMRDAAERSASGSTDQIQEAIDLNNSAKDKLDQAQSKLTDAQTAFPQVEFDTISTYISLKMESADLALSADEALINGDIETAQSLNDEFAKKDEEVVAAAAQIPSDPTSLITTAYEQTTADIRGLYQDARTQATQADVFIRDYVGITAQAGVQ